VVICTKLQVIDKPVAFCRALHSDNNHDCVSARHARHWTNNSS